MGDNYCATAGSLDQVEEHKDRQAVDYIFTDQAPDSLEDDDTSACAAKTPIPGSEESQRKGETNDFLTRLISFFSFPSLRGRPK